MEVDWSKLPEQLLDEISNRLTNLTDHVRFRAVCRGWANTSPPSRVPRQVPWALLPYIRDTDTRTFLSTSESKFYRFRSPEFLGKRCCGSSHGWLALVDGTPDISLYNPLSDEKILLPKLTTLPEVLNFREDHEDYLYRYYKGSQHTVDKEFMRDFFVYTVLLSESPALGCHRDCWAVLCYDIRGRRLAFCRLGDESWNVIENEPFKYIDLTFHKEKLYAIDSNRRIIICDLNFPQEITDIWLREEPSLKGCLNLTEIHGALVFAISLVEDMVDSDESEDDELCEALLRGDYDELYGSEDSDKGFPRIEYDHRVQNFLVFELDEDAKRLVKVNNLHGHALFLSFNCSMSLLASKVPKCRDNCIYFFENFEVKNGVYTKRGYELCCAKLNAGGIRQEVSLLLQNHDRRYLPLQDAWYTPSCTSNWMPHKIHESVVGESVIWIPNAKGSFSIKSNPPVDIHQRFSFLGPIEPRKWKAVLDANLPEWLQLTLWRVACGVLPSNFVSNRHSSIPELFCPLCHQVEESLEHLSLLCEFTQVAWRNSSWPLCTIALKDIKISDLVDVIAESGPMLGLYGIEAKKFILFVGMFIDQIWVLRNRAASTGSIPDPLNFTSMLKRIYEEHLQHWFFKRANCLPGAKWIPPPTGEVKVNFDVAMGFDFVTLALTCRDNKGRFLVAWAERIHSCDPFVAKAKAALMAVSIAIQSGFTNLVVEGDVPGIILPLQRWKFQPVSAISGFIGDIRILLASTESWCVKSTGLKGNIAAHNLACWAAFYATLAGQV
ncbi:uncharacterized protein LOC116201278 isoform X2 [Punica granatum]|uniref:Uncharacterized protein LOC116201278 isoform X2 n=1 Tax=Punica granatum TaxID=22663 RepID=A0A6P8CW66_PUNGR|nr:uncharacterized protein LOC116201278 isoform X2 [Punica granatum]